MELEVRHLRVICAIAETGSLTRAAAALRLTQPGLSAQLRRIETMLGGPLFHRHQSGVDPTPFGELVLTRARALLPGIDELLNTTARTARAGHRIRLGSVNAPLLGGLINAISALLPAGHPRAAREGVGLQPLAGEDWAAPRPDNDRTRDYWASVVTMTGGPAPRTPYEAEGRLLIEIVRAGRVVSLCQATFDEVPGVAVRPIAGNPLWYRHILAWHRDGPLADLGDAITRQVTESYEAACSRSAVYARWREKHLPPESSD